MRFKINQDILVMEAYPDFLSDYQYIKTNPARGDNTIIMIEKVNDSIEVSVALCSDGNIF